MNKKLLAGLLALSLTLSVLASCSSSKNDDDDDTSAAPKASASESETGAEDSDPGDPAATEAPADTDAPAESVPDDEPETPSEEGKPYTSALKQVGSFENNSDLTISSYIEKRDYDSDTTLLFDYMGNPLNDGNPIYDIRPLDNKGLYSYAQLSEDKQYLYSALMDSQGNVIIPMDEKVSMIDSLNDRYLALYYPEGITDNENEAIFYLGHNIIAVGPGEDDTLYKGHISIFDLETKALVPNIKLTKPTYIYAYGDLICIDDSYYNSKGEVLDIEEDGYSAKGNSYLVKYDRNSKIYSVCDHNKKELFKIDVEGASPSSVSDDDEYIVAYYYSDDGSTYGIYNSKGELVVDFKYTGLSYLGGTYFYYHDKDSDLYGILDAETGKEITKAEYEVVYGYKDGGVFTAKDSNGYVLIDTDGNVIAKEDADNRLFSAPYYIKDGDNYKFFNYSTKDFSIDVGDHYNDYCDVFVEDRNNSVVYDIRTGEKVIDGYDSVFSAYGYFYAVFGDKVYVYEVE